MSLIEKAIELLNEEIDNLEYSAASSVLTRLRRIADELGDIEDNL